MSGIRGVSGIRYFTIVSGVLAAAKLRNLNDFVE